MICKKVSLPGKGDPPLFLRVIRVCVYVWNGSLLRICRKIYLKVCVHYVFCQLEYFKSKHSNLHPFPVSSILSRPLLFSVCPALSPRVLKALWSSHTAAPPNLPEAPWRCTLLVLRTCRLAWGPLMRVSDSFGFQLPVFPFCPSSLF